MLTGNKGEWSEIYTLFKIISDQVIYAGDSDLNKIESLIFPIIKILRDESNGTFEFEYENNLVVIKNSHEVYRVPLEKFKSQTILLLNELQSKKSGSFSLPIVEEFINSFNCRSIKAKSSVKSDIRIRIHDYRTGIEPELGFSIKSQLGSPSTLLNASKATNFIYEITGITLTEDEIKTINKINSRSKIKDRITRISSLGGRLKFIDMESTVFKNNLILIDSSLPKILSESLIYFYTSNLIKTSEIINEINRTNPLDFNIKNEHPYYSYKIKRFLTDVALGMMPGTVWTGQIDTTGGFLVVRKDGDVLCYHIYNRNEFEEYLLKYTKFETASSNRHGFGTIYEQNGQLYFKLNLQIRFL